MCLLLLEEQQSQLQMNIVVEDEAADEEKEDAKRKVDLWEYKRPCCKESNSLAIGITSTTSLPSQPSKLPSISVTSILKKGMQVNCNVGSIKTNLKGEYG